ncbi:protein BANP-like [Amphiura filiformis]|uniref:protein BANP-like n=1 Tax=Amphiura filiformis TaxID=82378 RepID=UPI003B21AF47
MSEPEMTVQVTTCDNEIMTITMTPTTNSATMGSDQEGVIATAALQMVEEEDIIDDNSYRTTLVSVNPDEPVVKRQRLETTGDNDDSIKGMLLAINRSLCARLDGIESKVKHLQNFCQDLDGKVKKINATLDSMGKNRSTPTKMPYTSRKPKATVVGLPPNVDAGDNTSEMPVIIDKKDTQDDSTPCALGSNVTLITLNCEDDFPHGSWLGDPNNIQCRVRCAITPTDLLHVMETSRTADKCALKLMDYLFDRDVQATSNLSGTGKHSKKQLDPLLIYGIRCHLVHKYGITDQDWHRIKLNIDSKCRTAFRRKQKGLPLKVKDFSARKSVSPGSIRVSIIRQRGGNQNVEQYSAANRKGYR